MGASPQLADAPIHCYREKIRISFFPQKTVVKFGNIDVF